MGTGGGRRGGFCPGVEVLQPGQLVLGARGPSRYFGGDGALATKVTAAVEAVVAQRLATERVVGDWAGCCRVGVADGLFTAGLAALRAPAGQPLVVPGGASAGFLAPLSVRVLATADLEALGGFRPGGGERSPTWPPWLTCWCAWGSKRWGILLPSPLLRYWAGSVPAALLPIAWPEARGNAHCEDVCPRPTGRWRPNSTRPQTSCMPPSSSASFGRATARPPPGIGPGLHPLGYRGPDRVRDIVAPELASRWCSHAGAIGERVRWQLEGWALTGQPTPPTPPTPSPFLRHPRGRPRPRCRPRPEGATWRRPRRAGSPASLWCPKRCARTTAASSAFGATMPVLGSERPGHWPGCKVS